jgi:N-acetylglucosamine-6-phosphate deacetylase
MATAVPAASIGLEESLGTLEPGRWADLVLLDEAGHVQLTMVGGKVVYRSDKVPAPGAA